MNNHKRCRVMSKEQLSRGRLRMRAEAVIYKLCDERAALVAEQVLDEAFPMGYEAEAVTLIKDVLLKKFGGRPKVKKGMAVMMEFVERWRDARSTIDREPQQEWQKSVTRRRGRPKETIKGLIANDEGANKLTALHNVMAEKKGKAAAIVIKAAIRLGWIMKRPTAKAVQDEFGDIGNVSGYNKYMSENDRQITDEEIAGTMQALENMISQ